jgi:hypothetical protein
MLVIVHTFSSSVYIYFFIMLCPASHCFKIVKLANISLYIEIQEWIKATDVRFQVLTAASMMFRIVFWDVLPCKIIVDRRFGGTYCLHHQG